MGAILRFGLGAWAGALIGPVLRVLSEKPGVAAEMAAEVAAGAAAGAGAEVARAMGAILRFGLGAWAVALISPVLRVLSEKPGVVYSASCQIPALLRVRTGFGKVAPGARCGRLITEPMQNIMENHLI